MDEKIIFEKVEFTPSSEIEVGVFQNGSLVSVAKGIDGSKGPIEIKVRNMTNTEDIIVKSISFS